MNRALKIWVVFSGLLLGALLLCAWKLRADYLLNSIGDLVQTALPVALTAVMAANAVVNRGRTRAFWIVAAGGAALWAVANGMWTEYEVFLRKPVPVPFVGDVLFFLHIVPFTAAIAMRPHRPAEDRMDVGGVDFLMLLTWWVYLYLFVVIPWQYVSPDKTAYATNFNALYTIENSVLVAGCALLALRTTGKWRSIYLHLFGASALYLFASQLVNNAITRNVYSTGSAYDLPLIAAMCWFVATGILALKLRPQTMQDTGTKWHAIIMARLAMLATLSMPVVGVLAIFGRRPGVPHLVVVFRLSVTLGAMVVLPFLLFLKQHLLDRELVRLLGVSEHNLEMRKRLQAQLVQTEKLSSLGYLVAGAAHEINNPLTAILGYADLLQRDVSLLPHARQFAQKIGEQGRRTKELVSDLLKFGRQAPPVKEAVDLNYIVENAVELRRLDLHAGITIEQQLDPNLPDMAADPNQMLQVCFDIIGNAVEALNSVGGGELTIRTSKQNGSIVLEFKDSGPGVKDPSKIFDPFYTTKPVGHGTGLGLSAAYGIVREHGGLISCDNEGGRGATFKIILPLAPTDTTTLVSARAAAVN